MIRIQRRKILVEEVLTHELPVVVASEYVDSLNMGVAYNAFVYRRTRGQRGLCFAIDAPQQVLARKVGPQSLALLARKTLPFFHTLVVILHHQKIKKG